MVWGAVAKVALKTAAKEGAKQTIKGSAKKAVKKKLSAKNIKSNLLKKRGQLKKLQIERQKQESDTLEQSSSPQKTDSGKDAGSVLGFNFGFLGKIFNVTMTLIFSWVIRKVIQFTEGIGKTINAIKPIWNAVMGTLEKIVNGIKWIFEKVGQMVGLVASSKEIEDTQQSLKQTNEGINKELEKTQYGKSGDVDEEREEKKETDQKDAVVSKALKESSDFIESEATINQIDDKQTQSQKNLSPATMLGKVDNIVKGKADKSVNKLNNAKSDIHPAVQGALDKSITRDGLGGLKTIKTVNGGLGPTQKMKNQSKMIIQPVERIVRVGGGSGSSGGGGSSNIKSPAASASGGTSRIP